MKINDKNFYTLFGAAVAEHDRDKFIAEWSSSSIFSDGENTCEAEELASTLENIFEIAHMSMRDLRKKLGLTQAEFAWRFCLPKRTVESWESSRSARQYLVLAFAQISGLLIIERER